jgi:hypothetical protein
MNNNIFYKKNGFGYLALPRSGPASFADTVIASNTNTSITLGLTTSGTNFIKSVTNRGDLGQDIKYYYPTGVISTSVPFQSGTKTFFPRESLRKYGMGVLVHSFKDLAGFSYPQNRQEFSGYNNNVLTIISNATGETSDTDKANLQIAILTPSSSGTTNVVLF